jgi:dienelactone hydrolase
MKNIYVVVVLLSLCSFNNSLSSNEVADEVLLENEELFLDDEGPLDDQGSLNTAETLAIIENSTFDQLMMTSQNIATNADYKKITQKLLDKIGARSFADTQRVNEHSNRALTFRDKTMRFSFDKIGKEPGNGFPLYISLHGGGHVERGVNDWQWELMKSYYRDGIKTGIHVATRGISDTWDMHFLPESYALYARLIENMILYENVDPNRVYILGFSAGGDAVYQIAPRFADRLAGANMSAGHSNSVDLTNLQNLPFLIQMGENDTSVNRNKDSVTRHIKLKELKAKHEGYPHELFLHKEGSHNSWRDDHPNGSYQVILKDPTAWLNSGDGSTIKKNTNAVHWLDRYKREAYPKKIVWNPQASAPYHVNETSNYLDTPEARKQIGAYGKISYWLDVNNNPREKLVGQIIATYHRAGLFQGSNRIDIIAIEDGVNLRILLNTTMVNFAKPIDIAVKGKIIAQVNLKPSLNVMMRTLLERGDPSYSFQAEINLTAHGFENWIYTQHD